MKIAGLIQLSRYDGKRPIKEKEKPSYIKTELTDFNNNDKTLHK